MRTPWVVYFAPKGWWGVDDEDDVLLVAIRNEESGYRALAEGEQVEMEYEAARQDSFNYRALRVRRPRHGP